MHPSLVPLYSVFIWYFQLLLSHWSNFVGSPNSLMREQETEYIGKRKKYRQTNETRKRKLKTPYFQQKADIEFKKLLPKL